MINLRSKYFLQLLATSAISFLASTTVQSSENLIDEDPEMQKAILASMMEDDLEFEAAIRASMQPDAIIQPTDQLEEDSDYLKSVLYSMGYIIENENDSKVLRDI